MTSKLAALNKQNGKRVLGIDASTQSIAFCLFDNESPIYYGEIFFEGADVYERILDAKRKIKALKSDVFTNIDYVAIEAAVVVKSVHIGIKMAYVFGAIMGEILDNHTKVVEVHPISWQSFINNKNFTKTEKEAVKIEFPNKSDNWYKAKIRDIRKHKTLQYMSDKGIITDSDNVADAAGLSWYAVHNISR
jgi:Holliday junction resolvasome RuvABC endonuclease subunit